MSEPALRIANHVEPPAPAVEPIAPRLHVDLAGCVTIAQLVAAGMHEREAQRFAEALARKPETAGFVEKYAGKWHFAPTAPSPDGPPGSTLRDFLFLRTGLVVSNLLGVYIPDGLAQQITTWTETKRARFYAYADLVRQLVEHERALPAVEREERDRLFRADTERDAFCQARGIKRWSARSVREFRRDTERGVDWDCRGRPRHEADANAEGLPFEAFFRGELLKTQRKLPTIYRDAVVLASAQGTALPSISTVRRWAKRTLPAFVLDFYRLGPRRWNAKHAPFIERELTQQYRPNECWVGDHHQFDFWSDAGGRYVRLWLSGWLDMASRKLVGWCICESPNSDTLLAAFKAGGLEHGAPEQIYCDNGKDYRARGVTGGRQRVDTVRVDGVMNKLGIRVIWATPYHPQAKPIERFFGTLAEDFSKRFATYCGKDTQSRPEALNERLRTGSIEAPSADGVRALFAEWVAVYNAREHGGLSGRTPDQVFADNPIPRRTAPREVLDVLLMRAERCIVKRGTVRPGTRMVYGQNNPALLPLNGTEVEVRMDPADAARVLVFDLDGRFITEARNERLRGVTPDEVREGARRRATARRLAKAALGTRVESRQTTEQIARQLAASRQHSERQAELRKAAGAESCSPEPMRGVQLLPGATQAAAAVDATRNALQRRAAQPMDSSADVSAAAGFTLMAERAVEGRAARANSDAKCPADRLIEFNRSARDRAGGEAFKALDGIYDDSAPGQGEAPQIDAARCNPWDLFEDGTESA